MKNKLTKKEFLQVIKGMGNITEEQRNKIACALLGHSLIQTTFLGYYYCSRCGQQVGDKLGSDYDDADVVIVGHNCDICRKNYKKLTWRDKIYCPDPFKAEEAY